MPLPVRASRSVASLLGVLALLAAAIVAPGSAGASHYKRYVVYAIDLTPETATTAESCPDVNGDKSSTRLDCELELALALHDKVNQLRPVWGSVVGYAGDPITADVAPDIGFGRVTLAGADYNNNNVEDLEEVVVSAYTGGFDQFTPVSTKTTDRDYDAALEGIHDIAVEQIADANIQAALLTTGGGGVTSGPGSELQKLIDLGVVVNGFALFNLGCDFGSIREITDATGGVCKDISDPSEPGDWFLAPRPDGLIKRSTDTGYIGNNVYNANGANQTRRWFVEKGGERTFNLKMQNDGTIKDSLKIEGSGSSPKFKVTYLDGVTDVTTAVTAGTYSPQELDPNDFFKLKLQVKAKALAQKDDVERVVVTTTSATGVHFQDVVKAKVTVK